MSRQGTVISACVAVPIYCIPAIYAQKYDDILAIFFDVLKVDTSRSETLSVSSRVNEQTHTHARYKRKHRRNPFMLTVVKRNNIMLLGAVASAFFFIYSHRLHRLDQHWNGTKRTIITFVLHVGREWGCCRRAGGKSKYRWKKKMLLILYQYLLYYIVAGIHVEKQNGSGGGGLWRGEEGVW